MKSKLTKQYKWLIAGSVFAAIWPSASTATKIGLTVAQPLVIAVVRFAFAGLFLSKINITKNEVVFD